MCVRSRPRADGLCCCPAFTGAYFFGTIRLAMCFWHDLESFQQNRESARSFFGPLGFVRSRTRPWICSMYHRQFHESFAEVIGFSLFATSPPTPKIGASVRISHLWPVRILFSSILIGVSAFYDSENEIKPSPVKSIISCAVPLLF